MNLQLYISNTFDPFLNLAVEGWLLDNCQADTVTFYLWRNDRTVVIGQNQNPYAECNVDLLESEGGHLARRTTGGGAVFHDVQNLNFSFIAPKNLTDTRRNFQVIADALSSYGIEAAVSGRNDMQSAGRKFSGSAFHNSPTASLHHGTILINTDIALMQRYLTPNVSKLLKHGVKSVESRVVNLSELADISVENLIPRLEQSFKKIYGQNIHTADTDQLKPLVLHLRDKYASDDWRFGKWKQFRSSVSGSFAWGSVDIALTLDGSSVVDCQIASDSLDTDAIASAQHILLHHDALDNISSPIILDILNLVKSKI